MTFRERLITALFFSIVAFQIIYPTVRLFGQRPAKFAWQMFATTVDPHTMYVNTQRGLIRTDASAVVPNWRGDIRTTRKHLALQACNVVRGAKSVEYLDSQTSRTVPCER